MTAGPVAIIGLGCIGGSLARALVARDVPLRAWGESAIDRDLAAAAGIPVSADLGATVRSATVVVLAVPVPALAAVAEAVSRVQPNALVMHTASLQGAGLLGLSPALAARVIGTHPLSGSHERGFAASRADLFAGCSVSVEERADARARAAAGSLWRAAGAARCDFREAGEHDLLMTWVSHLPQLTATALAGTLASHGIAARDAGTGARDTTRLAASPLEMWGPLLTLARPQLDIALAALEARIAELRHALSARDGDELAGLWESARAWRLTAGDPP